MRCHTKPNKLPLGFGFSNMQLLGLLYTIHCMLLSADIGMENQARSRRPTSASHGDTHFVQA